jgi:phosphoglycolate phosphatase
MRPAIVYDLDGTLIDSAQIVIEILNSMREERSLLALPGTHFKPWISMGGTAMIGAILEVDASQATALLLDFRSRYLATPTNPSSVFPQVHATLNQLQAFGIPLGLCTNKPRALTEKILAETGLDGHFEVVCAGDDLGTHKPHPNNLQFCLKKLNYLAENTFMVGDSRIDQQLAKACGASFAFYSGGYDDGVVIESHTCVIKDHNDILNHV